MKRCVVSGCEKNAADGRMCPMHQSRWHRHGTTDAPVSKALGYIDDGYRWFKMPGGKRRAEHVLIAERALGRSLKPPEQIHHFNEIRSDNRPGNLIVCPDMAYHKLLHARQAAMAACGNPDYRKCVNCRVYDDLSNLKRCGANFYHLPCRAKASRDYMIAQRERVSC